MMTLSRSLEVVTPQLAAEELLRRRQARNSLIGFTTYTYPQYEVEPVHQLIGDVLEQVVAGEITRLMVFAPPQHGKSELVSRRLPAYWLARRPDDPVILTSYSGSLAYRHSADARSVVQSEEFACLFPEVTVNRLSRAVDMWRLTPPHRGYLLAAGVGGPITGSGAMLGIIDDPLANWEQAQSATIRNKIADWYSKTFRTRIWEGGAIILIMTRWHEDDLAGRIIQEFQDNWHILRLPALSETQYERDENNRKLGLSQGDPDPLGRGAGENLSEREPLAPNRYSLEELLVLRREVGILGWSAEYQGVPTPLEGERIKREWLSHFIDRLPVGKDLRRARYWDKGGTEGAGSFTVGIRIAIDNEGIIYIEDVIRGQWSYGQREEIIRQTAIADAQLFSSKAAVKIFIEQEPGSGGKESAEATIRNLSGFSIRRDMPRGDKDMRLEPFAVQAEAGNVRLVRSPWNEAFIDELTTIPNSAYRDQGDAVAGAYNRLVEGFSFIRREPVQGLYSSADRLKQRSRQKAAPHKGIPRRRTRRS